MLKLGAQVGPAGRGGARWAKGCNCPNVGPRDLSDCAVVSCGGVPLDSLPKAVHSHLQQQNLKNSFFVLLLDVLFCHLHASESSFSVLTETVPREKDPLRRYVIQQLIGPTSDLTSNFLLDGATTYSRASSPLDSFLPNSPNELLPFLTESLTLNAQRSPSAPLPSQNRQLLDNTSQNELQASILPVPIASDTQLTNIATTNTPQHSNQPDQSFHRQCGHGTSLSPPRASVDISQPFNEPLFFRAFQFPSTDSRGHRKYNRPVNITRYNIDLY
ncbi:hypothetical protein NL676_024304 [Syzygium grande]|nr:hypothetical protein NL676_024304 [Syzygium grande]